MITPRLEMILRHARGNCIADLGTDHAYIPIALAKRPEIRRLIATDLREGPLAMAKEHIRKNGCADKIELRLGSGLSPLADFEADTVLICGMGGVLISELLSADAEKAKHVSLFLLQPMNGQYELRKWLLENGFEILEEDIAQEGFKIYNLILTRFSGRPEKRDELSLHLPEELSAHPLYPALRAKKMREFQTILAGQKASKEPNTKELRYYEALLLALKEREKE